MDPSSFAAKERLIPQDDEGPWEMRGGAVRCYAYHVIVCAALLISSIVRHPE